MNKVILPVLLVSAVALSACSSKKEYCETSYESNCGAIRVKTHTEVVDYYQTYQPVMVYQPTGTYSERRVCSYNRC